MSSQLSEARNGSTEQRRNDPDQGGGMAGRPSSGGGIGSRTATGRVTAGARASAKGSAAAGPPGRGIEQQQQQQLQQQQQQQQQLPLAAKGAVTRAGKQLGSGTINLTVR